MSGMRRLAALDSPRCAELDSLARLAAYICGTSTAAVQMVDEERQWSAAAYGYDPLQIASADAMSATSVLTLDVSYTSDASRDDRWADNPYVDGRLDRIRLYAAVPLLLEGKKVVGALEVADRENRELTSVQIARLTDIAEHVSLLLELRAEWRDLNRAATHDTLTGLPNRVYLEESLRLALAKYQRGEPPPALVFLDLDGFKAVNDTYGHAVGDELLRAFCARVQGVLRASDMLTRLAGDELVILSSGLREDTRRGIESLVARLRSAFLEPYQLSCGPLAIHASIGVAIADDETEPEQLLVKADAEMYVNKRARKSGQETTSAPPALEVL